jgi:iron(III) transport system permease protein
MRPSGPLLVALVFAGMAATPVAVLLYSFLTPEREIWSHLAEHVLPGLAGNTAALLALVIPMTAVLGIGLGWLTTVCDYPGRKFFSWALTLPLAVPPYVYAFVYLGLLDFAGPVQSVIRQTFPGAGFTDVRNVFGVAAILSLAFYPYVFLLCRSAFLTQGRTAIEAARTLGLSPSKAFFRVAIPMARPWIAAGVTLVGMETLADFGAVSIFNYDTFTTAIYKAWFGLFSLKAASQLSAVLVAFVLAMLILEQRFRARLRFTEAGRPGAAALHLRLTGTGKWLAFALSSLVFTLAFAVPCLQLLLWAWKTAGPNAARYLQLGWDTLTLGLMAAAATSAASLLLAHARRSAPGAGWIIRIATLGYAMPGTILAVGIFIPAAFIDNALLDFVASATGMPLRPFIQGSLALLVIAYAIRFLAAGFGSVDSAMQRITPSVVEAARTMGCHGAALVRRVHLPMTRTGILTGAILVLVDVMKELPVTLMMRPFGWDTLAVKIYEFTSEGEWKMAAAPALVLIAAGLLPIMLLTGKTEARKRP